MHADPDILVELAVIGMEQSPIRLHDQSVLIEEARIQAHHASQPRKPHEEVCPYTIR